MVIDWKKQIDACIRNTRVIPIFRSMPIEKRLQEVYIVQRLVDDGYDNQSILNWFNVAEDDCIKTLNDIEDLVKLASIRRKPKEHDFTIYITPDEIEYVNSIRATKECKKFLLGVVAFTKVMKIKKGLPTLNSRERSFIYFITFGVDKYHHYKRAEVINKFIHTLCSRRILKLETKESKFKHYGSGHQGGYYTYKNNTVLKTSWIDYSAEEGYQITDLATQLPTLCDTVIQDPTCVCEKCGKSFVVSPKTKRKLCDECYKNSRKSDRHLNLERSHHKVVGHQETPLI